MSQNLPLKVACEARGMDGMPCVDARLWRQLQIIPSDILRSVRFVIGRGAFYISLSDPFQTVSNAVRTDFVWDGVGVNSSKKLNLVNRISLPWTGMVTYLFPLLGGARIREAEMCEQSGRGKYLLW